MTPFLEIFLPLNLISSFSFSSLFNLFAAFGLQKSRKWRRCFGSSVEYRLPVFPAFSPLQIQS
jgi:hypothetical protein